MRENAAAVGAGDIERLKAWGTYGDPLQGRLAAAVLAAVVALQALRSGSWTGPVLRRPQASPLSVAKLGCEGWASSIPLWSPEVGNGFPLMADGQTGVLYLPNIVLGALLPVQWALS